MWKSAEHDREETAVQATEGTLCVGSPLGWRAVGKSWGKDLL